MMKTQDSSFCLSVASLFSLISAPLSFQFIVISSSPNLGECTPFLLTCNLFEPWCLFFLFLIPCSTCLGSVLALAVPTNEPCVHRRDADISTCVIFKLSLCGYATHAHGRYLTLGCPCRRLDTKDIKGREGSPKAINLMEALTTLVCV
ncbi:MAG: hypothetical protein NXY57DRAFT_616054 [Lentinula lateritia]|nr:MAG: hypothetical protein NXY57DRAFT_616054 [Lentinula lateritia]